MNKDQPTARLLLTLFRAFEQELLHDLANQGVTDVTQSHLNILRHLNNNGMQISHLARDAALSKQLVGRIVKELAQKGYLELTTDPDDARAKFICYTPKGSALIKHAVEIVTSIEQRYQTALGSEHYHQFRQQLEQLLMVHVNQEKSDDN